MSVFTMPHATKGPAGGGTTGPFAPTRQKLGGGVSSPCGQLHIAASSTISQTAITDLWYHYS
jgi:hypothetical protein